MSVAPKDARALGGAANSRVNNASIITRINCYGHSILICGDMENECWDMVLNRSGRKDQWRNLVSNIDVLVAPHHGHTSGFSTTLLQLAKPRVVLVSVVSGDQHVDSRYSGEAVSGIIVNGNTYKALTTRSDGTISFTISPPKPGELKGIRTWINL
jgi:beta-lactamase superfamily II metal-dependent hydrolase